MEPGSRGQLEAALGARPPGGQSPGRQGQRGHTGPGLPEGQSPGRQASEATRVQAEDCIGSTLLRPGAAWGLAGVMQPWPVATSLGGDSDEGGPWELHSP